MKEFDFAIIGGGIFGIYTALWLTQKGKKVILVEKEKELLGKASKINQARLHSGYHYPRSIGTAIMSYENKDRFYREHQTFINDRFDKYYAIEKHGSFTDAIQFSRFCDFLNIKCQLVKEHPFINFDRLEALYLTREFTFDPILIADYYRSKLLESPVAVHLYCEVQAAENMGTAWKITLRELENHNSQTILCHQVVNATYAGSNAINRLFGLADIELMHEISEMAFVTSPQVNQMGLTVMDGPFASLMPYGYSGLLSLSSVAYTHQKVSYSNLPTFDCQNQRLDCRPDFPGNCNYCWVKPESNWRKMISQIQLYFSPKVKFHYYSSMFTIKSKLKANYIDDGRPTEISLLNDNPRFYCIFAGKINSIYEVEKVIEL